MPLYPHAKRCKIYPLNISDISLLALDGRNKNGKTWYEYIVFFEFIGT